MKTPPTPKRTYRRRPHQIGVPQVKVAVQKGGHARLPVKELSPSREVDHEPAPPVGGGVAAAGAVGAVSGKGKEERVINESSDLFI